MKKRFLAMLVTVAMLAAMLTPIGAIAADPVVTTTYLDIDFESWGSWEGDGVFGGATQSNGDAINHDWWGDPYRLSKDTVSDREGYVMKATIPTSGGSDYLLRTRMSNVLSNYNNIQVLWNEFSIKYEDGFAGFGTNENTNGYSIISINKNGQLELGSRFAYDEVGGDDYVQGAVVSGGQLELDTWYNVKVAADFTDANASSGVPTYVWLNGTLISSGVTIPNIIPGYGWGYNKLYFDQAETVECAAYIDDVKVYDTATLGDIENPDDSGDTDIDNSAAKTKSYLDIDFESWGSWEGDGVFGGATQSNGDAINHDWWGDPYRLSKDTVSDREGYVMKATIPTSGGSDYLLRTRMSNVLSNYNNIQVLWNEFSIKYEDGFAGFGTNENTNGYSIISINKNGQLELGSRFAYDEVGGDDYVQGAVVSGGQLELDTWYNVKVAADFTDANASAGVPTYVWLNGTLISSGVTIPNIIPGYAWGYNKLYFDQAETIACTAYIDDVEVYETAEVGNGVGEEEEEEKVNVMTEALNSLEASLYPIHESHAINKIADGIKSGDYRYKSNRMTAEDDGLTVVAALDGVYSISSVVLTEAYFAAEKDNELKVTIEIGKNGVLEKVIDNQPVNKRDSSGDDDNPLETTYNFAETEGDTIVYTLMATNPRPNTGMYDQADYNIYEIEAYGTYVEPVAETGFVPEVGFWFWYGTNSIANYYISAHNAGDEDIKGKLFVAAYNDDNELMAVSLKEVTLCTGANILSGTNVVDDNAIGIFYNSDYTYKAFFFESTTAAPILAPVNVIK